MRPAITLSIKSARIRECGLWLRDLVGPDRQTRRCGRTTFVDSTAAYQVFQKGHIPIIGVNLALPVIESAGRDLYKQIMVPMSLAVSERCDAVLRIGGVSRGADQDVEKYRAHGLRVFRSVEEIPLAQSSAG